MVTTVELGQARTLGSYAAGRQLPATSCPFDPAGDARQRALASSWVRGYLHRRPPRQIDYNDDE